MTDAAIEYQACERQILYLRATGLMRDELEDPVLERMDWLWPRMTPDEQVAARARARAYADAQDAAPMLDRNVEVGGQGLPREEAA